MPQLDVIVAGLGGVGAAACYHAARRGRRVLGLERFGLAHDRGSSHGETRIVRRSHASAEYLPLIERSYELWRELERAAGRSLLHTTGLVMASETAGEGFVERACQLAQRYDFAVEPLNDKVARARFHHLRLPPDAHCFYEPDAGYVLVEESIRAHCTLAQAHGAELRFDEPVDSFTADGDAVVVTTPAGSYRAARLVIAGGPWSSELLAELELPLVVERIPQAWYPAGAAWSIGASPSFILELRNGYFFGTPSLTKGRVKVGGRSRRVAVPDPAKLGRALAPDERVALDGFVAAHLEEVSPHRLAESGCMCTMTPDEHFLVDQHPRWPAVVFAAGLSGHGYKFAPVLGEALADLALDGTTALPIDFLRRHPPSRLSPAWRTKPMSNQPQTWRNGAVLALLVAGVLSASACHPKINGHCTDAGNAQCLMSQQICLADGNPPKCEACPPGTYAYQGTSCGSLGQPSFYHEFQTWTIPAGAEYRGKCQSWTLNNPSPVFVNAVELSQDELSHHSIWTFVPDDHFPGPDGSWDCTSRNYDDIKGALDGGILYAQSTQATHEVQKFPAGTAVRIPAYARIISDIHLLNATTHDATGSLKLGLYAIAEKDVKVSLVPFQLDDRGIHVLANAKTRLVNKCGTIADAFKAVGGSFNPKIYYLLPHTHGFGTRFLVQTVGGTRDGETIFDLHESGYEAHGLAFDPPYDVSGATGLNFTCEYANDTAETLGWGWSYEMCQMLGYMDSTIGFSATVFSANPTAPDGKMNVFQNDSCVIDAVPWDFNKPGGPPPS